MKKLTLFVVILALLVPSMTLAHNGSLLFFTDRVNKNDCDMDLLGMPQTFEMFYYRSSGGPNGITGSEFKMVLTSPHVYLLGVTWNPLIIISTGDIATGIAISFSSCQGRSEDYVWFGTIEVLWDTVPPTGVAYSGISDMLNPEAPQAPIVTDCDELNHNIYPVSSGFFHFTDGACALSNGDSTWGAIKSLYVE
ncbi:MAG: hypothetical protein JXB45_10280 [Candidatus Krumholzibacteriota bacterium]|nr:hypothetical protein [Candidatus Krumholzibacteriota bacterium]